WGAPSFSSLRGRRRPAWSRADNPTRQLRRGWRIKAPWPCRKSGARFGRYDAFARLVLKRGLGSTRLYCPLVLASTPCVTTESVADNPELTDRFEDWSRDGERVSAERSGCVILEVSRRRAQPIKSFFTNPTRKPALQMQGSAKGPNRTPGPATGTSAFPL